MSNNYLAHYGVIGMKWGVRRYQNRDGSLTSLGRKHLGIKESSNKKSDGQTSSKSSSSKSQNSRTAALEKARNAKAEKKAYEEGKKNALEKGNATEVLKYKGDLSNKELQDAYNRINLERQLSSIAATESKSGWDKMDSIVSKIGKLKSYADKGIEVYNLMAKIHNSTNDEDNQWKVIGADNNKSKGPDEKTRKIINTGSAEEVLKAIRSGKITGSDVQTALKRLNTEDALEKMISGNPKKPKEESKEESKSSSPRLPKKSAAQKALERDPGYIKATKTLESEMKKRVSDEVEEAFKYLSPSFSKHMSDIK